MDADDDDSVLYSLLDESLSNINLLDGSDDNDGKCTQVPRNDKDDANNDDCIIILLLAWSEIPIEQVASALAAVADAALLLRRRSKAA